MSGAFLVRALLSGVLVAIIALVARRSPGLGGLIAAIPLVSTLAMIWIWVDTQDREAVAAFSLSAFWYFLPTVPMFVIIPLLLRQGTDFWLALGCGVGVTMLFFLAMSRLLAAYGVTLS